MSNTYLSIEAVGVSFGPGSEVLRAVDLKIARGEFVSIIGHSGCGKSTLLNVVAGLLPVSTGAVILDREEVNAPGPDRAVVFQNHSLLPWLSVYENVRLGVDKVFARTKTGRERHDWTLHNLDLVQMGHARNKRPNEISGGMKQRVGIARALAMQPKVLLLDEPFGALDALTRAHLQDSVMEIHAKLNNTVLMITHDVDEAALLSDRVVMMTNGPAATIGEVLQVKLARPRKRFLYFDFSFMCWVLLGPLGIQISKALHLDPAHKGLMVATPGAGRCHPAHLQRPAGRPFRRQKSRYFRAGSGHRRPHRRLVSRRAQLRRHTAGRRRARHGRRFLRHRSAHGLALVSAGAPGQGAWALPAPAIWARSSPRCSPRRLASPSAGPTSSAWPPAAWCLVPRPSSSWPKTAPAAAPKPSPVICAYPGRRRLVVHAVLQRHLRRLRRPGLVAEHLFPQPVRPGPGQAGYATAACVFAGSLLRPIGGWLADRIGGIAAPFGALCGRRRHAHPGQLRPAQRPLARPPSPSACWRWAWATARCSSWCPSASAARSA
jgi:nitrate/nitrite transport system ATP-binding protein